MDFKDLFLRARKADKQAILEIIEMYRPLMIKNAIVNNVFDEDLYQEYVCCVIKCIQKFPYEKQYSEKNGNPN